MVFPCFPRVFPIENSIFWEKVRPSLDEPMAIGDFGAGGLFSHDVGDEENVGKTMTMKILSYGCV